MRKGIKLRKKKKEKKSENSTKGASELIKKTQSFVQAEAQGYYLLIVGWATDSEDFEKRNFPLSITLAFST